MCVRSWPSANAPGLQLALSISLEEPTRAMLAEAASAGVYRDAAGRRFPRVQLRTIAGLLSGQQHPDHQPGLNFKQAQVEADAEQEALI